MLFTKQIIILAGPNGAGKTTAHSGLIPPFIPFVNADNIPRQLKETGKADGTRADLTAGRLLLAQIAEFENVGDSFAVETNLANRALTNRIPGWQAAGYEVSLYYIWVPSADFAVSRVAQRVASGGHNIPESAIRRRYYAGLKNLFATYIPLVDAWRVYNNLSENGPTLAAYGLRRVHDWELWSQMQTQSKRIQDMENER